MNIIAESYAHGMLNAAPIKVSNITNTTGYTLQTAYATKDKHRSEYHKTLNCPFSHFNQTTQLINKRKSMLKLLIGQLTMVSMVSNDG